MNQKKNIQHERISDSIMSQFLEGEKQIFSEYIAAYLMVYLKFTDTIQYAGNVVSMMRDDNYRYFYEQKGGLDYYNTNSVSIMNKINYEGQYKGLWGTQSKINRNLENGTLVSNVDFYTNQLNNYKISTDLTVSDYISNFLNDLFNTVTNVNKEINKIVYQPNAITSFSSKTLQSYSNEKKSKRKGGERKDGEDQYISLVDFATQQGAISICDVLPSYIKNMLDRVTDYYRFTKIRLLVFRKQSTLMGDTLLSVATNVNTIYTSMVNLESNTLSGFGLTPPYQYPLEAYKEIIAIEWGLVVDYHRKVVSIYTDLGDRLIESLTSNLECKGEVDMVRRTFKDIHRYMYRSVDRVVVYPHSITSYTQHRNRCNILFSLAFSDGMIKYYERTVTYIKQFDGGSDCRLSKHLLALGTNDNSDDDNSDDDNSDDDLNIYFN
jgi:hypothetical protein